MNRAGTPCARIISASRRCDLPAMRADRFLRCLQANTAEFLHPYTHQPVTVSLAPRAVLGYVFWSKDFSRFHAALDAVRARDNLFCCLYTITGLDAPFEAGVPPLTERIADFQTLAERFGPTCMVWRFDPIVISTRTPDEETLERFAQIAAQLSACTRECIVSFVQPYPRATRRLAALAARAGVRVLDPPPDEKRSLLQYMTDAARTYGIAVNVCCQDELVGGSVGKAHCVDIARFQQMSATALPAVPRKGTRRHCGCSASCDIGTYQACKHDCVYCYAR
jgi:hypothetical protein